MKFIIPSERKQEFDNEYNSWAIDSPEIYLTVEREVTFDNLNTVNLSKINDMPKKIMICVNGNFINAHPKWTEFIVQ